MNGNNVRKTLVLLALVALVPAAVWAAPGGRPAGPPPEALSACDGKNVGDAVQFTNRRGETVEATCRQLDGQLVALPDAALGGKRWSRIDAEENGRGERHLARLAGALNLTDAQQQQVRAIFAAEQERAAPLRTRMAENREKLQQAIHAGADEAAIRALATEQGAIKTELLLLRAEAWRQIHPLLTPEQQELAKTALPAAGRGSGKRGGPCWD